MFNGKDVVLAAKKDLESFFKDEVNFSLKIELDVKFLHHASIIGTGEKLRIRFSKYFCSFNISEINDLHYSLFIVSHEIAHYLNAHNKHKDESSFESKSLEAFADFFGSKIMMIILTYGNNFRKLYEKLGFKFHSGEVIDSIGSAFSDLAESLFNTNSDLYSNRITRIGHCSAGIMSFLDNQFSNTDIKRSMNVFTRIYSSGKLPNIIKSEGSQFFMDSNLIRTSDKIHKDIQGTDIGITKGLKPEFKIFIGTEYFSTEESRSAYIKAKIDLAQDQGFDIPRLK